MRKGVKEKLKKDKNIDLITCNKKNSKNYINTPAENNFLHLLTFKMPIY